MVPHDLACPGVEDGAAVTWVVAGAALGASESQRSNVILQNNKIIFVCCKNVRNFEIIFPHWYWWYPRSHFSRESCQNYMTLSRLPLCSTEISTHASSNRSYQEVIHSLTSLAQCYLALAWKLLYIRHEPMLFKHLIKASSLLIQSRKCSPEWNLQHLEGPGS